MFHLFNKNLTDIGCAYKISCVVIGIRKNDNGILYHEENFEEAIRSVNFAYNQTSLPTNIQNLLQDEKLVHLTSNVSI